MNTLRTRILRPLFAIAAAAGLSACASVDSVDHNSYYETTSRAVPVVGELTSEPRSQGFTVVPSYKVVAVNVDVPASLQVSEANRYLPRGDIVWREDPIGNRHEQVDRIMTDAFVQGLTGIEGQQEVVLDIQVTRFHALTEKARYSVGGVHAIQFNMQLRDAQTGAVVMAPKFIKADFDALGGQAAVRAEAAGITQKVRITNHLAHVIREEIASPYGYSEQKTGVIGALNQI